MSAGRPPRSAVGAGDHGARRHPRGDTRSERKHRPKADTRGWAKRPVQALMPSAPGLPTVRSIAGRQGGSCPVRTSGRASCASRRRCDPPRPLGPRRRAAPAQFLNSGAFHQRLRRRRCQCFNQHQGHCTSIPPAMAHRCNRDLRPRRPPRAECPPGRRQRRGPGPCSESIIVMVGRCGLCGSRRSSRSELEAPRCSLSSARWLYHRAECYAARKGRCRFLAGLEQSCGVE